MNGSVMLARLETLRSLDMYRRVRDSSEQPVDFLSVLLREDRPDADARASGLPRNITPAPLAQVPQPVVQSRALARSPEGGPRPTTPGKILTKGVKVTVGGATGQIDTLEQPEVPVIAPWSGVQLPLAPTPAPGQYLDVFV